MREIFEGSLCGKYLESVCAVTLYRVCMQYTFDNIVSSGHECIPYHDVPILREIPVIDYC